MKILVAIGLVEINGHRFFHGAEIMPGLLTKERAAKLLDEGRIKDYSGERRSLYRVFAPFSGCKEREQLSDGELTAYGLPK